MEKIHFKDRISKYPNRKKLKIISKNEQEIVADVVSADEPQVEGTVINAKILNNWQEVISNSEDNALLAKNKVHLAEDNARLAVKYAKDAINKAEQAEMVAEYVSKSVNNTFIPIKTSELFNDSQFVSVQEQTFTSSEQAQARQNIGAGTSDFSGDYEDLTNKPDIPDYGDVPTKEYVEEKIAELVNSAPETLDTLGELAAALQENSELITTLNAAIANKVDKVTGKGLSTNDYTTDEQEKLSSIEAGAEKNVQSDWLETDTSSSSYIQNKPTLPTSVSELNNDAGYLTASEVSEIISTNDAGFLTSGEISDIIASSVDDELSTTSKNAAQNKVITEELNNKLDLTGGTLTGNLEVQGTLTVNNCLINSNDSVSTIFLDTNNSVNALTYSPLNNILQIGSYYAPIKLVSNSDSLEFQVATTSTTSSGTTSMSFTTKQVAFTASSATEGDIATLDTDGQMVDSGVSLSSLASKTLLWSGSIGTNGYTLSLDATVTDYDALLCCGEAWSNTGFTFLVGTTKLQPAYSGNYTSAVFNSGTTGNGVKGTSFYASVRVDNENNKIYYQTGYDSTGSSNQAYLQRVYGINFGG